MTGVPDPKGDAADSRVESVRLRLRWPPRAPGAQVRRIRQSGPCGRQLSCGRGHLDQTCRRLTVLRVVPRARQSGWPTIPGKGMLRWSPSSPVAGRGLGRKYAGLLAARGARVVVNDLGGSVTGDDAGTDAAAVPAAICHDQHHGRGKPERVIGQIVLQCLMDGDSRSDSPVHACCGRSGRPAYHCSTRRRVGFGSGSPP